MPHRRRAAGRARRRCRGSRAGSPPCAPGVRHRERRHDRVDRVLRGGCARLGHLDRRSRRGGRRPTGGLAVAVDAQPRVRVREPGSVGRRSRVARSVGGEQRRLVRPTGNLSQLSRGRGGGAIPQRRGTRRVTGRAQHARHGRVAGRLLESEHAGHGRGRLRVRGRGRRADVARRRLTAGLGVGGPERVAVRCHPSVSLPRPLERDNQRRPAACRCPGSNPGRRRGPLVVDGPPASARGSLGGEKDVRPRTRQAAKRAALTERGTQSHGVPRPE